MQPTYPSSDPATPGQRFDFPAGPRHILTIAFTLLWFAGWLFLLVQLALDYVRFRNLNIGAIAFLVLGGVPVALALLWTACGKCESLIVAPTELRIYRWVGPIRLVRAISAGTIVGLRSVSVPASLLSDFLVVRQFYGAGCGALAIDTTRRTLSVGHTLSAEAARQVIEQIHMFLPQLATPVSAAVPRRRPVNYMTGLMTASLVGFAVTTPARLLIIDRPICFYDNSIVPRDPIDVSRMRPSGHVYLVPIDDFPVEQATAITEHFREKFGIPIEVACAGVANQCVRRAATSDELGADADAPRGDLRDSRYSSCRHWPDDEGHVQPRGELAIRVQLSQREPRGGRLAGAHGSWMHGPLAGERRLRHGASEEDGWQEHRYPLFRSSNECRSGQHVVCTQRRTAGTRRDERVVLVSLPG
jgi:hypothetical protein